MESQRDVVAQVGDGDRVGLDVARIEHHQP
jgi:hypothetical protein